MTKSRRKEGSANVDRACMETTKIWPGWEIKEQIGEGDFGKVFRMERTDAGITGEAALKVIEISGDSSEIKMFRKMGMDEDSILEIYEERKNQLYTSIARLSSLRTAYGIASVEDFDSFWNEEESSWTILIRSEFLESLDVYGKKKGGVLLPEEIAGMGRDIAGALMTLEKEGITSLSVKPSNILRNSEGSYKLSDAGINEGIGRLAASKVGTLFSWDAPELVKSGNYDQTSDIYSLGMVMYVLLNGGKRPFMEEGGVQKRWMQFRIANERRVSGEPLPKPVYGDEELQNIVLKACAPRPEDRYKNALELRDALEIWLFGQKYGKSFAKAAVVSSHQQEDKTEWKANAEAFNEAQSVPAAEIGSLSPAEQEIEKAAELPERVETEIPSAPAEMEADLFIASSEPEAESPSESFEEPAEETLPESGELSEAMSMPEFEEEPAEETLPEPEEEPAEEKLPEYGEESEEDQFEDLQEEVSTTAEDNDVEDKTGEEADDEGVLHVKAEEDLVPDAVPTDSYGRISLFKKTGEEPEFGADIKEENPSVSDLNEDIHEKELNPFSPDSFSASEPFELKQEPAGELQLSSEDLFHSPDFFDSSEEKKMDPTGESAKSSDESVSDFLRTGDDFDAQEQNEEIPVADVNQEQPESTVPAGFAFFGKETQEPSQGETPYGTELGEAPNFEADSEPEKEEIPPTADVFIYIFQRDDRLFGIHSVVSENGGGARLKMKSEILETGLFEMILDNLRKRTVLPIENAFVTIGSGASQKDYVERKEMVLAAGLKSVTVLDDAAVNALGVFAEEFAGQEGEHYVLSVIHDFNGFHSSLLKFDKRESSVISVLKSEPTAKVLNPMENPAFIMDRMLQDNCRVGGVDYSGRVERVLVDNRNRPLFGSVGQGSFDPYYNEVYGSIFQRASLYERIEVLKGLAYYDSCTKGEINSVRVSLSVFEEPINDTPGSPTMASQENGSSAQDSWMGFGTGNGAGTQGSEPAFTNDQGRDMADPNFSTMESTSVGKDPFGTGGEAFGSSSDPFGTGGEAFGSSSDPFGADGEAFGSSSDPFGAGGETFGSSSDPFGAGGRTFGSSPDPFGAHGDIFNATVAGDNNAGRTNGNAAFGRDPFGDELTADGFGEDALGNTSSGSSNMDGFGGVSDNRAAVPVGFSYSDRGRIYMLNENKPINDVTMEVNDRGIDLFRKDIKIALAFGMIGSAIEGKGKKFAHIDFSQIRGFGYETPNAKIGQRPALYTTDGNVYIFDFVNAAGTENILRQIAGEAGGTF